MVQLDYNIINVLKAAQRCSHDGLSGQVVPTASELSWKKGHLCMSVLREGNSKKGSGKCGRGGLVVFIGNLVTLLTGRE